ncbi:MAG: hypothetical protein UX10_C0003G0009 [Candidatus Magasanikbacteria bacterium GW2011_GWA2_45_39]|uniref:Uncharacterized protein n=2 Tax=Candidatus Magasanikiibacteriota TaxID=1752731 RepID=A0A0G1QXH6_9BACT|nr:MAG: hypothetical protein UX10_C0003G0009 [Candidatus Magasanikbacteria bacterium GW2011_GWA2_45_39]KKU13385.1 MAG: hypothetical protein UX20_C0023G0010 [Candidatus Magasanikbacteria bacterium GW2011_GWC2_45_8]HBW74208.1 hypothetical protein [Candidatus Magasanikbacteria bacterium]
MPDDLDPREAASRTSAFQSTIEGLVQNAVNMRDGGATGYDFKVTELIGRTQDLGDDERHAWETFCNYLQTADENTYKDFRSVVETINQSLITYQSTIDSGNASDQIMSRAKFLEWLRGKIQPLETGIDLEFVFDEFREECLKPLKKELHING